jgi:imidazoleglycerol phosphate dehydratase HisB
MSRVVERARETRETTIELRLDLDGSGQVDVRTGLGFLDHMLTALAFHAGFDLMLRCDGDLHVDDHHTAEDCALALGSAIDEALGDRTGIERFASAYVPLDESLARTVVDLSGRPCPVVDLALTRPMIGDVASENLEHFFRSLAVTMRAALHVDVLRGDNDHHKAEAAFKSTARALRQAVALTAATDVPSTKGVL